MHALWVREHNLIAQTIAKLFRALDDDAKQLERARYLGWSAANIAECSPCDEQELIFDVDELTAYDDLVCEARLRSGTEKNATRRSF